MMAVKFVLTVFIYTIYTVHIMSLCLTDIVFLYLNFRNIIISLVKIC